MLRKQHPFALAAVLVCATVATCGCRRAARESSNIGVTCLSDPAPPRVGQNAFLVILSDAQGKSVAGARVELEANMSHPGMGPATGTAVEVSPGSYRGGLEFSMRGDWSVIVHVTLANGHSFEREVKFQNVQPAN